MASEVPPSNTQYMRKLSSGTLRGLLATASILAALLISAGSWTWGRAWLLAGLFLLYYGGMFAWGVYSRPPVLYERAGTIENLERGWDRLILGIYFFSSYALYILAGLDHRVYEGGTGLAGIAWAGLALVVFSFAIPVWAIAHNPFAGGAARVQTERGHQVVESGPYRFIRHPIYLASLFYGLGLPLFFDSQRALLPGVVIAAAFIWRTKLEDQMLKAELPGYAGYAARVPFRLFPGIW